MSKKVLSGLAKRLLPQVCDKIDFEVVDKTTYDEYWVRVEGGRLKVKANCAVAGAKGLYSYLREIAKVDYSWTGNRSVSLGSIVDFEGEIHGVIKQKYRVYMNYCTLNYSMAWWDFERWEKEIDYMALNGINMPLTVIGTEAVWYETLLQFGYDKRQALDTISSPAFWAWQLMTNIVGYLPPPNEDYVYRRLELGKKILARVLEYGMYPIQQGFCGHLPTDFKEKYPKAKYQTKYSWCNFPPSLQLDPTDPLFTKFGHAFLKAQEKLLGNHHFYAADPFHEGRAPRNDMFYLRKVGKTIDNMFKTYDDKSVWVMQSWSMRGGIVKGVNKDRLLILDLNSVKSRGKHKFWGYDFVAGEIHNFGGKNAIAGDVELFAKNTFSNSPKKNIVGTGLFMEGINQNPFIYDLLFYRLSIDCDIDVKDYFKEYAIRRYGGWDESLSGVFELMLDTVYSPFANEGDYSNILSSRPELMPKKSDPCGNWKVAYDFEKLVSAVKNMAKLYDKFKTSDGYLFDLTEMTKQIMSNLFAQNQEKYKSASLSLDKDEVKRLGEKQLDLLRDLDALLSHRSERSLATWISEAHSLAETDEERKYFDLSARAQITMWGDIDGESVLGDYAWKEWSGLINEYYYPRWQMFYEENLKCVQKGKSVDIGSVMNMFGKPRMNGSELYKRITEFELAWIKTFKEYPKAQDSDPIKDVEKIFLKWF